MRAALEPSDTRQELNAVAKAKSTGRDSAWAGAAGAGIKNIALSSLRQGCRNGSMGGRARDPEGGPESRLWAAVVERGQEARTARPDGEYLASRGEVAGYADLPDQTHHPVLWKQGKIRDLGTVAGDPCGRAQSVNARGQVVGGTSDCSYFVHAFLWEDGGPMLDLNRLIPAGSGLELTFAININDRGGILAKSIPDGVNPHQDADLYGHLVLLVPCEPENGESCEASLAQPAASVAIARSIAINSRNPSSKFTGPSRLGRIDLRHGFGVPK